MKSDIYKDKETGINNQSENSAKQNMKEMTLLGLKKKKDNILHDINVINIQKV